MDKAKIVFSVLLAWAFFGACACRDARAGDSVGFINLQRLLYESKMGKAAQDKIYKIHQKRMMDLDASIKEVDKKKQEMEKSARLMTHDEQRKSQEELQKAYAGYEEVRKKAQDELNKMNTDLISSILDAAGPIMARVARAHGYSMIIKDPLVVGFMETSLDITTEVIQELDKQKPQAGK